MTIRKSQAKLRAQPPRESVATIPLQPNPAAEPPAGEAESAGRYDIAELIATVPDHKALFGQMMDVVKRFVDFDWASLFVYSANREYSRMVCWYGPRIEYPARWFEIDPAYRNWLELPQTWMGDLKEDVLNGPAPHLLERPDLKISLDAGTRALIGFPVWEGGELKGGLCLLSHRRDLYDGKTRALLDRLMLNQALLAVYHAAERTEALFISDLIKKIADAKDLRDLARIVVTDFARFYKFENTAIFKVNVLRKRFELLWQEPGFEGGTRMVEGYSQPLDKGLLGLCHRYEQPVLVNDVNDGSEESQQFLAFTAETSGKPENAMRSELCIPIRLFGRILWILNVEDRRTGAFNIKELETLQGVFQQMQVMLERMFQRDILFQVLEALPDGLVILEQNGTIIRSNRVANRMFERDNAEKADISHFFADPDAKASFTAEGAAPSMTIVRGERGKETQVLVSKFTLPEEYDHVVLALHDVSTLQWRTDFEGLKAALAETVGQVRVPISLLASYVQQIEQNIKDEKLRDLTRKAFRQIGRVELTYDRVLASYNAQALPPAENVKFDVKVALDHIVDDLPNLERGIVDLDVASSAIATADPFRVMFALNSMLAYLLRARPKTERVGISVRTANGTLDVDMVGAVHAPSPQGELAELIEDTRTQLALGQNALERIAQECGGRFERVRQTDGRERLSLRLATAH